MFHIVYGPADATASQNPVISCLIQIQTGFTLQVPAYSGCPGKEDLGMGLSKQDKKHIYY